MSTVHIYKSTDPGAPAHPSSERGSMAALLRACLIDGYGSGDDWFDPAGWEEPYGEVNHYACFRSLEGDARLFYQVDDLNYSEDVTRMTMFDSMSDAETGFGDRGSVYFGKWYNATESQKWVVVADERTCYVVLESEDDNVVHGFGEYLSLIDDDPCPAFLAGHGDSEALANDAVDIPLHQARIIQDSTFHHGYIRRCITSAEPSSFSCLNVGVASGSAVSRYDDCFSTMKTGVSWLHLPLMIKAIVDVENDTRLPCGILRGLRQTLTASKGEMVTEDMTLYVVGVDGGSSNTGRVAFDITGSWS